MNGDLTDYDRRFLMGIAMCCGAGQRAVYADPEKIRVATKLTRLGLLDVQHEAAEVFSYVLTAAGAAVVEAENG